MATVNAVWGLDIGQCALKALRLAAGPDGSIEVTHFDVIEHPKILSQPDAETGQLIQNALEKFLSRNELSGAKVALSVPGQASFARFIKLPPVEPKRIPEIVRFEAVQQIPFDINEVEWDYQTFFSQTSPDVEVGIFAMRKELVYKHLGYLRSAGIDADIVQLAPLALYNMMVYDGQAAESGASILIDVGAENTDLVISDGERIWLRSIPLGGNNFTESLVKAFKLPFSKAENLKRTAATSKYARQIFVAMRPVFGDLVSEVQRSIGFYTSLHRDAHIARVVCMGNAFRLPGLQKYLEQNLQVETVRPGGFRRLKPSPTINAPAFAENLWTLAVAYGLCLQGLDKAPIRSSLLPFAIARQRNWRAKRPWFAAAAALMVFGVGVACYAASGANSDYGNAKVTAAEVAGPPLAKHLSIQKDIQQRINQGHEEVRNINEIKQITGYRPTVPQIQTLIQNSLPNEWQEQAAVQLEAKNSDGSINWAKVWAGLGKPSFIQKPANSNLAIYIVEDTNIEFFSSNPPPFGGGATSSELTPGMGFGEEGMGGQPGGPGFAPMPSAPPPPGPPGPPPVPGSAQPAAETGKYFRVTLIGLSNVPGDRIANAVTQQFLGRVQQNYMKDRTTLYTAFELDPVSFTNAFRNYTMIPPPPLWPSAIEVQEAEGPAAAAAVPPQPDFGGGFVPGPVATPTPARPAPGSLTAPYQVARFIVSFNVKVIPPVIEPGEQVAQTGPAAPRRQP